MRLNVGIIINIRSYVDHDVRLLIIPKGLLEWTSRPFILRLLKGLMVSMLEILSLVYILFIILWAFKLIIESVELEIKDILDSYKSDRKTDG